MKLNHAFAFTALGAILLSGCATTDGQKSEKGPHGTIAYRVEVDSSEPGARVEANSEFLGKTPFTFTLYGDKDGTFHNFGKYHYILTAYPVRAGQQPQTKDFRTGGWFTVEDMIPKKVFFDFGQVPDAPKKEAK